jgi:DNA helicase-2/ATP-dependent DNA helicase PcrA
LDDLKDTVLASIDDTDVDTASDVVDAIDQIRDAVAQAGSIEGALAQFRVREDSSDAMSAGVHLLNAHTGKGQQFDWVFILGFEKGNVPSFLARSRSQLLEEDRVLLVMLSRARHGIVLTRSQTLISKAGRVYGPDPSPWIPRLRHAIVAGASALAAHIGRLPVDDS